MRRWDRLVDSYMEEYRARGVSPQTIAYTEARLNKWGRWLKSQRPRIGIEDMDAEMLTQYTGKRASFRAKATVYATLSTMRGFGDYLVRQGLWKINPLRWMKGPKVTPYSRLPKRIHHVHMEAMWREAAKRHGNYSAHLWVKVLAMLYGSGLRSGRTERNVLDGFNLQHTVRREEPRSLSLEEAERLVKATEAPGPSARRDRLIVLLLYGCGLRTHELYALDVAHVNRERHELLVLIAKGDRPCSSLCNGQADLSQLTIRVRGKGGHERVIPLNPQLAEVLRTYVQARGPALPTTPFFRSRFGRSLCRGSIYERVRTWGQRSRVGITLSPHRMRHTFATHLVRAGVGLVTIRDLLGHRLITSTQIYLHVTADDLRAAAARHPISKLLDTVKHLIAVGPLPFQRPRPIFGAG